MQCHSLLRERTQGEGEEDSKGALSHFLTFSYWEQ